MKGHFMRKELATLDLEGSSGYNGILTKVNSDKGYTYCVCVCVCVCVFFFEWRKGTHLISEKIREKLLMGNLIKGFI